LQAGAKEISAIVGRKKGVGEVISFCLSQTAAVRGLLDRASKCLADEDPRIEKVDIDSVSLMIVGRARHPYLQFLADIVSSDFDADKLDYLLRDAAAAGLPLRYDLDRYLSTVRVEPSYIADDEHSLEKLYNHLGVSVQRKEPNSKIEFEHYDSFQLRLPKQAMSTIEQIVICKFMLFSYIYHHKKVRAAEGMLARTLRRWVDGLRRRGATDENLLCKFIALTDASLHSADFKDLEIRRYCTRISNRILPHEVLGFVPNMFSHISGEELKDFTARLLDSKRREEAIREFEEALGEELLKRDSALGSDWKEALWRAGAWLDVPSPPKFENVFCLWGPPQQEMTRSGFPPSSPSDIGYRPMKRIAIM
jgi:HD superfamily phosphohydrolase